MGALVTKKDCREGQMQVHTLSVKTIERSAGLFCVLRPAEIRI
jgi:hypothetical protein